MSMLPQMSLIVQETINYKGITCLCVVYCSTSNPQGPLQSTCTIHTVISWTVRIPAVANMHVAFRSLMSVPTVPPNAYPTEGDNHCLVRLPRMCFYM